MLLPADWDQPDKDNGKLCALFEKDIYSHNGCRLPFRLFRPQAKTGSLLPLVIYLHGADAVGNDNELPLSMHDVGTMFAKKEWQKEHPCYILAPQYGHGQHWSMEDTEQAAWNLFNETIAAYSIDPSRIYIYGYSAGGVGTLRMLKNHPSFFAAAISICGATGKSDLPALRQTPLWMIHAVDDEIVKASYRSPNVRELAHLGSRDIFDYFRQTTGVPAQAGPDTVFDARELSGGCELRYTEYPHGKMKALYGVHPHCSWVAMSDPANRRFGEWMFLQ